MSYCYIDSPYSYNWITGAYGFLRVYAYNDSGGDAELVSTCIRTTDTPPSGHKLDLVPLPHDPYVVWIVTYILNHKSYGYSTRHTLNATLYDVFGGSLGSSTVVSVGVTPPDAATDMHGEPHETHTSAEHWLAKAKNSDELFPPGQVPNGYRMTSVTDDLHGTVPETVEWLQVKAELCLPRYGGPHDLPVRHPLSDQTIRKGERWSVPLVAENRVHGAVVMLTFTNPDETSERRKTVSIPVQLFEGTGEEFPDGGCHEHDTKDTGKRKGGKGDAKDQADPPPPRAFRLTRPAG